MKRKYDHQEIENGKDKKWSEKEYFSTHDETKEPFSILLPPPNVTGKLHIGHAWQLAIQDAIIRFQKLRGKDVMWIPAMDHAGISTQAKVEARLREKGVSRHDLTREEFLEKAWEWKDEYAQNIRNQWQTIGVGLDYKNESFTLDEKTSPAVQKVFIDLFNRSLIYKDIKPINWDPVLQTVLSNIEVINKDVEQNMYFIKYPLKNTGNEFITIGTVRPETLFSDVAVAINPKNEKISHFIGREVVHPLTGEVLPIIADKDIELEKATGAMKVSAHAELDFQIIKRHNLKGGIKECIDQFGKMNDLGQEFSGLDRFEAREKIAEKLDKLDLISKVEITVSAVSFSERSNAPIEVLVQPQWFVKMKSLAQDVISDLNSEDGVNFVPNRFKKTLLHWMENIQDWCISRQLWWGHRIPVWYKDDEQKAQIESPGEGWVQDEDVLDTWFSSGIAPFTFLGWPQKTSLLERFYPSDTLVTAYDIIFFWVARMYFQSLDIMKEKPFKNILIHGIIRDEQGRKMSKTLGNGIDPIEVVNNYGSDAMRWFFLTNSTPGQDTRYSTKKMEAAWSLNNKIWNISRYILKIMPEVNSEIGIAEKWITNKFNNLRKIVEDRMNDYEFTIIGKEISRFILEDFSSWYIEISKEKPNHDFALKLLSDLMILIHPFLPFISDHIYYLANQKELLEQDWVISENEFESSELDNVIEIIKLLRGFRENYQISNKENLLYNCSLSLSDIEIAIINRMANAAVEPNNDVLLPFGEEKLFVKANETITLMKQEQIDKKIKFLENEISRCKIILGNQNFLAKAPQSKIEEEESKLKKYLNELEQFK